MGRGVQRFTNLRAWQACELYKKAVYRLCERSPLADDWKRRGQLEESVRGPGAHVAEGFGRFSPPDFARFVVMARASLMESQNHLIDLVDRAYIMFDGQVKVSGTVRELVFDDEVSRIYLGPTLTARLRARFAAEGNGGSR